MKEEKIIEITFKEMENGLAQCEIIPHTTDEDKIKIALASIIRYATESEEMSKLYQEAQEMVKETQN